MINPAPKANAAVSNIKTGKINIHQDGITLWRAIIKNKYIITKSINCMDNRKE